MSATRKLQTEIAQVLKKVEEGVALFDDIWSKVYSAGQQSLKEKYEGDLKKEIKKLQRLRDQIKTWLGSSEIKDKGPLTEARKVIESKMEQFKVCEKDTKTKAYSKEGLARDARSDPKEAAKEEKREWLNDCLDRLADLIDSVEADLEKITNKKKSKEQVDKLDNRIKKNRWHIARLEQVLKLMDNDDLDATRIDSIKDDVDYYIESAVDDDGSTGVDDEFDIYEDLALDSFVSAAERGAESEFGGGDALSPIGSDASAAATAAETPAAASKPVEAALEDGKTVKKAPVVSVTSSTVGIAAIGKPQAPPAVKVPPVVPPAKAVAKAAPTPVSTIGAKAPVVGGATVPAQLASHPGVTAAKGASAPASSSTAAAAAAGSGAKKVPQSKSAGHDEGEGDKDDGAAAPSWATAIAQNSRDSTGASNTAASVLFRAEAARNSANSTSSASFSDGGSLSAASTSSSSLQASNVAAATAPASGSGAQSTFPNQPSMQNSSFFGASNPIGSGPSSASGPATNLPIGGVSQLTRNQVALSNEVLVAAHMLKQSFLNSPESAETDRQSGYVARNPYTTHSSYPTKPPSSSENTALFERLPPDTLFFAFYYQQGGYQQYLAAKQLKKHSWRFHKKYMTWFQRHEEPKIATDDYEEGSYVYFDNENDWCQLIKQDFKFEFKFLEDEL